jgi:acylphosphatase
MPHFRGKTRRAAMESGLKGSVKCQYNGDIAFS